MEKILERLIEKHLMKDLRRITITVYKDRFDEVFKKSCQSKKSKETTIGQTFCEIEEMALIEVVDFMGDWLEEINLTRSMSRDNPFREVLGDLWYDAKDYLYFKDYISLILSDEWQDKKEELKKAGIIDEEGDYIEKSN
jgi:hypothetical protein